MINDKNEILAVTEKYLLHSAPGFFKLPGGAVDPGNISPPLSSPSPFPLPFPFPSPSRQARFTYLLPQLGEDIPTAVVREVWEETGIRSEFQEILCFRQQRNFNFGLYVHPLNLLSCSLSLYTFCLCSNFFLFFFLLLLFFPFSFTGRTCILFVDANH